MDAAVVALGYLISLYVKEKTPAAVPVRPGHHSSYGTGGSHSVYRSQAVTKK